MNWDAVKDWRAWGGRLTSALARPPAPVEQTDPADRCGMAFTIQGHLFQTTGSGVGEIHMLGHALYYDIPDGEHLVFFTGGGPYSVEAPPRAGPPIWRLFLDAEIEGEAPEFCLAAYDADGAPSRIDGVLKKGRIRLTLPEGATPASRACMILSGRGVLRCSMMRLLPPVPPAAPAALEGNRLYDLIRPDYDAARLAGAEVPPPPLTTSVGL